MTRLSLLKKNESYRNMHLELEIEKNMVASGDIFLVLPGNVEIFLLWEGSYISFLESIFGKIMELVLFDDYAVPHWRRRRI